MWSFGDSVDNYWLEEKEGIALMSRCGFRIFRSKKFGYFFGIDAGYDFYEAHRIPLYNERGLRWGMTLKLTRFNSKGIMQEFDAIILVKEYVEKYQVWEWNALKYVSDHKHGISALIIKDIYYDKIWIKEFHKEN